MRRIRFLSTPLPILLTVLAATFFTFSLTTLGTLCLLLNVPPAFAQKSPAPDPAIRPASVLVANNTNSSASVNARSDIQKGKIVPDMIISHHTATLRIDVHYPKLDIPAIDKDTLEWATQLADNFQNEFAGETGDMVAPYELGATYTLERPDVNSALTVVWDVSSYTQGAHGNLDIVTYSYALPQGTPISMPELFTDLGTALNLMSEASFAQLSRTLGDMLVDDMLRSGIAPDADNFSSFALIPGAIRIYFQPYQVAPWAAGPQRVDISLEELEDAGPQYKYWGGKKEAADNPPR